MGEVIHVYERSRQLDVVWPYNYGPEDAALMSFDEVVVWRAIVKELHCSECGKHPLGVSGLHWGNKCPCGGYYHGHFRGAVGCGPNCPQK